MALVRAHLYITGRVQGVVYREYARAKAEKLGLTGWVRNLRDGRVEAVIEGEREKVEEMVDFCREGCSPFARVGDIEVEWEEYEGKFSTFSIRF